MKFIKRFFIALSLIFTIIIDVNLIKSQNVSLIFKMAASVSFVMTALFAFLSNDDKTPQFKKFGIGFIIAACISSLADYTISKNFLIGMLLFFVSVLVYFFSCFAFGRPGKKFFIVTFAIYIPYIVIINLLPGFTFANFTIPVAVYSLTILIFTVKAFDVFKNKSPYAKMLPIGTVLFILSDFILLVQVFYNLTPDAQSYCAVLNLTLYFPAQLLIANSLSKTYF